MSKSNNGSIRPDYVPEKERRNPDRLFYEHGVSIANLAARTTSLEQWRTEMKPMIEAIQHTVNQTNQALVLATSNLSGADGAIKAAVDKINDRAWTTWRVMSVGAAFFVVAVGAAAWLADKVGMTIHFGG